MDTGEYETNALVINNISTVQFAFYEPSPSVASLSGPSSIEVENNLRKDGHLVYADAARRGLWSFRLCQKPKSQGDQPDIHNFPDTIQSSGYLLLKSEGGFFEPAALVKNKTHAPNSAQTPSSSSSSASSALTQSTTIPNFPPSTIDQDAKAVVPAAAKANATISIKDAHECLISAALLAVATEFCARTGAIALSSRVLLLAEASQVEHSALHAVLACFRIYLTTTGSLVVTLAHMTADNLISLSQSIAQQLPPVGITVLAAPLGMFANCQPIANTEPTNAEGSIGQSPDSHFVKLRTERDGGPWKNMCTRILRSRHIPLASYQSQQWVGLQRLRRKLADHPVDGKRTPLMGSSGSASWPAGLCFCKMFSRMSIENENDESKTRNFDPLKEAKTWFLGTSEREDNLERKRREREATVADEHIIADNQVQSITGLSPVALHRSNNGGPAPAGMYPTPPDGIQGLLGATPSMDGTMSSPGNIQATPAMVDISQSNQASAETYSENWEPSETKRERGSNSFEAENLFGELGPDMFGDNDITEADFNFFDEEPGDVDMSGLNMPDIANRGSSSGVVGDLATAPGTQIKVEPYSREQPLMDIAPPQTFAKPELRHARSSLGAQSRRFTAQDSIRQPSGTPTKRAASPLDPDTVYKRIRASLENQRCNNLEAFRKNSQLKLPDHNNTFDETDLGPGLSAVNSKYEGKGRFDYSIDRPRKPKSSISNEPPTTDYLRRHSQGRKGSKQLPAVVSDFAPHIHSNQDPRSGASSPRNEDRPFSDADDTSLVSDPDDSSYDSEPVSPVKSTGARGRRPEDDGESFSTSFKELEAADLTSPHPPLDLPRATKSEVELSLSKYFADPEPYLIQYALPDDQLIMAAQILTDQSATSTIVSTTSCQSLQTVIERRRQLSHVARHSIQELQAILPASFGVAADYQFRPFIEVQDVPLLGQPTRMQPRPPGAEQTRPSNLFQIPSPHFEIRRYESRLSVLPSAVSFWEGLGLSPSQGSKDINALCVFPDFNGLADDMMTFTDRLRSTYESFKLGSFNRLQSAAGVEDGMFPFEIETDLMSFGKSSSFLGPSLQTCASRVCKILSTAKAEQTTFVVFFVYSPQVAGSIVECCAVFNEIFEGYKRVLHSKSLPVNTDLALQLIPQEFVASPRSVAMPAPADFAKLSLEVYDRCSLFGGPVPSPPSPAIVLEQAPPRMIDFKLTTSPSSSLLHENTCLHIAYAQSVDERWVTVAWTDNRGSQQMTASYCLGRKGKAITTPLADVAHEIWATTRDLVSSWRIHWRVVIAKCGVMSQAEIELWSSLAQSETRTSISLTLVSVDTDPSLQLLSPAPKVPSSATNVFYTTPVSTPQGSILSPEQSGNPPTPHRGDAATSAPTPSGDHNATDTDADATLTDITDAAWGAVLSHRLNNSSNTTDFNPALISGYLVKRGGPKLEDPPVMMEVNIVHSEGNPRAYEALLREMITYYRGLGTLARARGMVDRETDVRPWHIAAAEKGVRALYMMM
ncbi:mediator complex subunit 13 C-terminal-domain-containing protein [Xylariaceae sp. FL0016]|nr:mediator complex subunit 13 C-terminal-domain-containing protein [Xylariaceae sp. FL0016]